MAVEIDKVFREVDTTFRRTFREDAMTNYVRMSELMTVAATRRGHLLRVEADYDSVDVWFNASGHLLLDADRSESWDEYRQELENLWSEASEAF